MTKQLLISTADLCIDDVINITKYDVKLSLSEDVVKKINHSNSIVNEFVDNNIVRYGITTGFGKFSDVPISKNETKQLQENLIKSHACGIGDPFPIDTVRAMMLLRINNISKGFSGTRIETVNLLIEMLNKNVTPYIPQKGSLGASGDLAPLSHMVLPLIGLGECYYEGKLMPSLEAFKLASIEPLTHLESKEGLSLINGTQVMTAVGLLTLKRAIDLMKIADIAASLTMEALNGIKDAFDERLHNARPHLGQIKTAKNILKITENSNMITSQGEIRIQDAYSLRCIPQVHGASKDAIEYVKEKVEIEINSVTDNPLIFVDNKDVISGGNFHGQPMALAFDFLGIALSEIANISERRIERLVNPSLNNGLPAFLVKEGGVNSGFMIVQYSAASLVSENKVLSHPASVDSIPSSANQEDHVSMGTIAARKASEILDNATKVLAMEILCATQAIDLRENTKLGDGTKAVYDIVRKNINYYDKDRIMYYDINKAEKLILDNSILSACEKAVGELL